MVYPKQFLAIFTLLALAAHVLATNSTKMECESYAKGALKLFLTQTVGNTVHSKEFAGINANNTAMFAPNNHSLLVKSKEPLQAELFKCEHGPHDKYSQLYQLRVHGKCATIVEAGAGLVHGLQLEDCAEKQEQKQEQWFLSGKAPNATGLRTVMPELVFEKVQGLQGLGLVSSFYDALSYSRYSAGNETLWMMLDECK